jgi:hypothetical protein
MRIYFLIVKFKKLKSQRYSGYSSFVKNKKIGFSGSIGSLVLIL